MTRGGETCFPARDVVEDSEELVLGGGEFEAFAGQFFELFSKPSSIAFDGQRTSSPHLAPS